MPNLNSGKDWSEMDIEDLTSHLAHGATISETADFLCGDENEVRAKMQELGLQECYKAVAAAGCGYGPSQRAARRLTMERTTNQLAGMNNVLLQPCCTDVLVFCRNSLI